MSKPIECMPARVNVAVNCGLWVIMMSPCRFIDGNICTTHSMGDVDDGGGYACVGKYGKSLHFLLNFTVNLKLL